MSSRISIIRCRDYDRDLVYGKVRESIDLLGGIHSFIKPGEDEIKVSNFRIPQSIDTEWPTPEWARRYLKNAFTTRPVINKELYDHCEICRNDCPRGAIKESGGRLKIDYRNCIRCFCCQEFCPKGAISVGKGWLLRVAGFIPAHP